MKLINSIIVPGILLLTSAISLAAPVNVNRASASEIAEALTGIGEKKAEAIVTYREQNGPFATAEDLVNVSGIGTRTVEMNQGDIQLRD